MNHTLPALTHEQLQRLDVAGPRYTSYPTAPEWSRDFGPEDYKEKLLEASCFPDEPLSLYVHIPFCKELCTYCGCNIVIAKQGEKADTYLDHVEREIALVAPMLGERRRFSQIHWGGGTPTFLDEPQLKRLWGMLTRSFSADPDAEIAIEVDPVITTRAQLALLRDVGFNRLSMGVQDFDPVVQASVNRIQSVEETHALLRDARELGYSGINFDLIYGLPNQTPERWQRSLDEVVAMRPDRLAVYSFAYIPELRHHMRMIDPTQVPLGAAKLDLFRQAYESFVRAGYRPIGMDHFALPDDELARAQQQRTLSRNFQGYTVKSANDCVAFGVTGISDLQGAYAQNVRPLKYYYDAVNAGQLATDRGVRLSDEDRRRRAMITQIMCNFWLDLGDEAADFEPELERLRGLEEEGLVEVRGDEVEVTPLGRVFVRNVAMVFDTYLRDKGGQPSFSRTV